MHFDRSGGKLRGGFAMAAVLMGCMYPPDFVAHVMRCITIIASRVGMKGACARASLHAEKSFV